jgi:hypothetical protein
MRCTGDSSESSILLGHQQVGDLKAKPYRSEPRKPPVSMLDSDISQILKGSRGRRGDAIVIVLHGVERGNVMGEVRTVRRVVRSCREKTTKSQTILPPRSKLGLAG